MWFVLPYGYIQLTCLMFVCFLSTIESHWSDESDRCLGCLRKNRPVNGCTVEEGVKYCGPLRIGEAYFSDCVQLRLAILDSKDYETCTTSFECASQCVRAMQSQYAHQCLLAERRLPGNENKENLTCADYGKMHYQGQRQCGSTDTPKTVAYLRNLTMLCGCEVLGSGCVTDSSTTTGNPPLRTISIVLYTVTPLLVVILVTVIIFGFVRFKSYRKKIEKLRLERSPSVSNTDSDITITGHRRLCNTYSQPPVADIQPPNLPAPAAPLPPILPLRTSHTGSTMTDNDITYQNEQSQQHQQSSMEQNERVAQFQGVGLTFDTPDTSYNYVVDATYVSNTAQQPNPNDGSEHFFEDRGTHHKTSNNECAEIRLDKNNENMDLSYNYVTEATIAPDYLNAIGYVSSENFPRLDATHHSLKPLPQPRSATNI